MIESKIVSNNIEKFRTGHRMKEFSQKVLAGLEGLLKQEIRLVVEGIPYMPSLIHWEIKSIENPIEISLNLYPAGFMYRCEMAFGYLNEVVTKIYEKIIELQCVADLKKKIIQKIQSI